jgi:hypothetical protein
MASISGQLKLIMKDGDVVPALLCPSFSGSNVVPVLLPPEANVAIAGPGAMSRIIADWPALALIIAVKLLTGMLNHPAITVPQPPADYNHHNEPSRRPRGLAIPPGHPAERVPATLVSSIPEPARCPSARRPVPDNQPRRAARPEPGIAGMLPAVRAARDDLHQTGQPLTRDSLTARLREPVTRSATPASPRYCKPFAAKQPRHRRPTQSASLQTLATALPIWVSASYDIRSSDP